MRRNSIFILLLLLGISISGYTQLKKQFHIENSLEVEKVNLILKVSTGDCYLMPTKQSGLLNVFSKNDPNEFSHTLSKDIRNNICFIHLDLNDKNSESFSQTISSSIFGSSNIEEMNIRKVFLSEKTPYNLKLKYGVGNARIDLSGLSLENLKVFSGSANVDIGYFTDTPNQISMDTFYVKVDLGSVLVKEIDKSKAKHVIADVGFGNLLLDFSASPTQESKIKGTVGAGTLIIKLPDYESSVRVTIRNSWLCSVQLPKNFKKIQENVYVSENYNKNSSNTLDFDIDVSMGSIIFK